jgi:hypothetical protein
MVNEKILNTRVQLKYDSYENWQKSNTLLKSGEVAIAYLGPTHTTTTPDNGSHPVLFKVGPGNFNSLPWASALAADVHTWAKQSLEEFTAWVAKTPKTVTLQVNGVNTDYTIEEAIKLVRNEITAGGEAAAITIADESTEGQVKYTAKQGGADIVESIVINEGEGVEITIDNNAPKISHQAKPVSGNAETATAGTGRTYVTEVLVDKFGHIAGVKTASETVDDTNTAHTHSTKQGSGIKANGSGDVTGDTTFELNVALELVDKTIRLYDKGDASKTALATLDAASFIRDGMIKSVELVQQDDTGKTG